MMFWPALLRPAPWRLAHRTSSLLALTLGVVSVLMLTAPLTVRAAESVYFYAGGQRHTLYATKAWEGVQLTDATSANAAVARLGDDAAKARGARNLARRRILLLPTRTDLTATKRQALRLRLRAARGVRRTLRIFGTQKTPIVETDELLVRFKSGVTRKDIDTLLAARGAAIVRSLGRYAPNGYVVRVPDTATANTTDVANALYESGNVVFSHPNFIWPREPRFVPNDTLFTSQWHLNNSGQGSGTAGEDVRAQASWDITLGSPNITVAVIDTGIATGHVDLTGTGKIVAPRDVVDADNDPRPTMGSFAEDHGTAVAGIAVGIGNNGVGISGIAPNCRLMPIRLVTDAATVEDEATAFAWAVDHGADIISNSWGPADGTGISQPLPDSTRAAIDYAVTSGRGGKGCVVFFAAGNGNESADLDGYASYVNVIGVAASTNQARRASYSDFGASVDVCAPSSGGTLGIVTTDQPGSPGYNSQDYTSGFGGTSAATPLAAGVAALVLSLEPNLTATQVRARLESTADKIDQSGGAYDGNGHSIYYGYGRVNALRALQAASTVHFTVSGRVTLGDGTPVAGVSVMAQSTGSVGVTSSTGDYTIPFVPAGANTFAPSLTNYVFTPASTSLTISGNLTGVNFTAAPPPLVTLIAPAGDATVSGSYNLRARTTSDGAVQRMDFARRGAPTSFSRSPNLSIADFATVTDQQTVTTSGTLGDADLTVSITHTYVGDLTVKLIAPDGSSTTVWNEEGASQQNLNTTFSNLPLAGKAMNGIWKIQVTDGAADDVGTLVSWSLTLRPSWEPIASDTNGASGGEWTAVWNVAATSPGIYEVKATAVTSTVDFSDTHTGIVVPAPTYNISGLIRTAANVPVANVTVQRSGSAMTTSTDAQGAYSFNSLTNGSYTVTPSLTGATFAPAQLLVTVNGADVTTANFTATLPTSGPTISGFTPNSGPVGTTVTVNGNNFTGTTGVKFGNSAAAYTIISPTSVRATVPSGAVSGAITITTGSGSATSSFPFTVTTPSAPTIISLTPASAVAGATITITGSNLIGATAVRFNNRNATSFTVVSSVYIRAVVPSGITAGPVYVTTPNGTASSPGNFTLLLPPVITTFSPVSGLVGATVTITGSSFTGATLVRFNNKNTTNFTVVSDTTINAVVPVGAVTGPLAVTTLQGSYTSKGNFFVLQPPTLTSFSPASGAVGATITISGTGFTGLRTLRFSNNLAPAIVSISDTSIVAKVPAGAVTGPISLSTALGSSVSKGNFFVLPSGAAARSTGVTLSSASVRGNTIQLVFAKSVDADTAADVARYRVSIGGRDLAVDSIAFKRPATIILGVASAVPAGARIDIAWHELRDARGQAFSGAASCTAP